MVNYFFPTATQTTICILIGSPLHKLRWCYSTTEGIWGPMVGRARCEGVKQGMKPMAGYHKRILSWLWLKLLISSWAGRDRCRVVTYVLGLSPSPLPFMAEVSWLWHRVGGRRGGGKFDLWSEREWEESERGGGMWSGKAVRQLTAFVKLKHD